MSKVTTISSEFDIFMPKPFRTAVMWSVYTAYKSLATVLQNDSEFLKHGDTDTYFDLDRKLYVRGKMISSSGKDMDLTDTTAVENNLLHSLFS